jgi:hypothetical protein
LTELALKLVEPFGEETTKTSHSACADSAAHSPPFFSGRGFKSLLRHQSFSDGVDFDPRRGYRRAGYRSVRLLRQQLGGATMGDEKKRTETAMGEPATVREQDAQDDDEVAMGQPATSAETAARAEDQIAMGQPATAAAAVTQAADEIAVGKPATIAEMDVREADDIAMGQPATRQQREEKEIEERTMATPTQRQN